MDNDIAKMYFQGDHEMEYKTIPEVLYDMSISLKSIAESLEHGNQTLIELVNATASIELLVEAVKERNI